MVISFTYIISILQIDKQFLRFTTKINYRYTVFLTAYCRAKGRKKTLSFNIRVFIFQVFFKKNINHISIQFLALCLSLYKKLFRVIQIYLRKSNYPCEMECFCLKRYQINYELLFFVGWKLVLLCSLDDLLWNNSIRRFIATIRYICITLVVVTYNYILLVT